MALTIGFKPDADMELQCQRCGHSVMLRRGEMLMPCPSCMHIEFEAHDNATEAERPDETGARAEALRGEAERLLELHVTWMSPQQRWSLARVLGELLARAEEDHGEAHGPET